MISKATLTLCLVLVGLAGVLATKKSRFSQFSNVRESTKNNYPTTVGICNLTSPDFYLTGTQTFSVYNNDADLYLNHTIAPKYGDYEYCEALIIGDKRYPRLLVEVIINTEWVYDELLLLSGDLRKEYTGHLQTALVMPTNNILLIWNSNYETSSELGFSMRVSGTFEESGHPIYATIGVCEKKEFYLTGPKTFSVFNNNADLYLNYTNAPLYNDSSYCSFEIYGTTLPRLKLEIIINSESVNDTLNLQSGIYDGLFSGLGYKRTTLVTESDYFKGVWSTNKVNRYELGFSLRVSGTFENATKPDYPNTTTVGLCDQTFTVFYLSGPQTFSVYNNDVDLNLNYTSAPDYAKGAYCSFKIQTKEALRLKVEVTMNSQTSDKLELKATTYERKLSGLGYNRSTIVFPGNFIYAIWSTVNGPTAHLGFSMRVHGII